MNDQEKERTMAEAKQRLADAAAELRALIGTDAERELEWFPNDSAYGLSVSCYADVSGGRIYLRHPEPEGVGYVSSFGPNSDRSFSGFLPGLTLHEAKLIVYHAAKKHW